MKKPIPCILTALVFSLCLVVSPAFAQSAAKEEEPFKPYDVGDRAPNFELPDGLSGEIVELNSLLGESVVALTFMNTSCGACRAEVSLLSKLATKHEGKLKVYLIAVDIRGEKLVKAYAESNRYNVGYLLDPTFTIPPLYGFSYTPALVLLDKEGNIIYKKGGYGSGDGQVLIDAIEEKL
jgi:thiol-disulfide isomerase/thioredoxin